MVFSAFVELCNYHHIFINFLKNPVLISSQSPSAFLLFLHHRYTTHTHSPSDLVDFLPL